MEQVITYSLRAYGLSDVGCVRQKNEDMWRALIDERFFVLADGMGGHQAGEIAAKDTVDALSEIIRRSHFSLDQMNLQEAKRFFKRSVQEVNTLIHLRARSKKEWNGMGTTLCLIYFHPEGVITAHAGDSRIYCYREKKLEQLTNDHTLIQKIHKVPSSTKEKYRHVITKAIGTEANVVPTVEATDLLLDDVFLLCSDGLSDMLPQNSIEEILVSESSIQAAAHTMIERAKGAGGSDNITVLLVRVE